MIAGQLAKNVVAPDLAAAVGGNQAPRLDPENFHGRGRLPADPFILDWPLETASSLEINEDDHQRRRSQAAERAVVQVASGDDDHFGANQTCRPSRTTAR